VRPIPFPSGTQIVGDDGWVSNDFLQWFTYLQMVSASYLNTSTFTQTASVTVGNTVTETSLFGAGQGSLTLPINALTTSKRVRWTLMGVITDTGTPTLNIRIKVGGATIASTGAVALVGTVVNRAFRIQFELTCRSIGASGTVIGQGSFWYDNSTNLGTTEGIAMTATATVDTTAQLTLDASAQWGTADPADTLTVTNATVEVFG